MAEKRMFAKTIVESGAFYNLSPKAQCLYLHLNMNADDDGLLNNAINICRSLGFVKTILQELINARYLLDLGEGIICIKHWRINNTIAKDRYKPTIYQDVFNKLNIKENKAYTDNKQNDNKLISKSLQNEYTDKNSIDKYRLDKNSDDDLIIKNISDRIIEAGYDKSIVDRAMFLFTAMECPKTSGFYQKIINTLIDDEIYDKEAYISQMARNEVKNETIF